MASKLCNHVNHIGYVSNQPDDYDRDKPLASRAVCARSECIASAERWVESETNMPAVFREFKTSGATK